MLKTLVSILVCLSLTAVIACAAPQQTPTATAVSLPTLEFLSKNLKVTGDMGDWRLAEGPHPGLRGLYMRALRKVGDRYQGYTCFYYPDSRGEVPRVNLAFPYPLKITAKENRRAVKSITTVGSEAIPVNWQTWVGHQEWVVLRGRAARDFLGAIIEQQAQEFTLTLPDNPELSATYSVVGLVQALESNEMTDCYR